MGDLISRKALLDVMPKRRNLSSEIGRRTAAAIRRIIANAPSVDVKIDGNTSDGYHTFNELYHHRAVLFSVIVKAFPERAWKSRKHHDGTMYDGMFIVGIDTPQGQATYHYDLDPYWKMFKCQELECAPEWDGHTPAEAIARIGALEPTKRGRWKRSELLYSLPICSVCGHAGCIDWAACPNCGAKMDNKGGDEK